MKSKIILTVEHDEHTDGLQMFAEWAMRQSEDAKWSDVTVSDYEVAVDIENAPPKTIISDQLQTDLHICAYAAENSDSRSVWEAGERVNEWVETHTDTP